MSRPLWILAASLLCQGTLATLVGAADAYRVTVAEGKHADIVRPDGNPILRYMFESSGTCRGLPAPSGSTIRNGRSST